MLTTRMPMCFHKCLQHQLRTHRGHDNTEVLAIYIKRRLLTFKGEVVPWPGFLVGILWGRRREQVVLLAEADDGLRIVHAVGGAHVIVEGALDVKVARWDRYAQRSQVDIRRAHQRIAQICQPLTACHNKLLCGHGKVCSDCLVSTSEEVIPDQVTLSAKADGGKSRHHMHLQSVRRCEWEDAKWQQMQQNNIDEIWIACV